MHINIKFSDLVEAPNAVEFSMYHEWKPSDWALKVIKFKGVDSRKVRYYLKTFKSFYLPKNEFVAYKTEWNNKFIEHCIRNYEWNSD